MTNVYKILLSCAVGAFGIASAQASVIYDWQPVSAGNAMPGDADITTADGRLEITYGAFSNGGFDLDIFADETTPEYPDSPIIAVSLDVVTAFADGTTGMGRPVGARPRDFSIAAYPNFPYSLSADIDKASDFLTGSLDLVTSESEYHMTGNSEGLWTIDRFGSDDGNTWPCFFSNDQCTGATGRWVRDTSAVPAPGGWLFYLAGALAVLGVAVSRQRAV